MKLHRLLHARLLPAITALLILASACHEVDDPWAERSPDEVEPIHFKELTLTNDGGQNAIRLRVYAHSTDLATQLSAQNFNFTSHFSDGRKSTSGGYHVNSSAKTDNALVVVEIMELTLDSTVASVSLTPLNSSSLHWTDLKFYYKINGYGEVISQYRVKKNNGLVGRPVKLDEWILASHSPRTTPNYFQTVYNHQIRCHGCSYYSECFKELFVSRVDVSVQSEKDNQHSLFLLTECQ